MPTPQLDRSVYVATARLIAEHGGNVIAAAATAGMNRNAFQTRAKKAATLGLWGRDGKGGEWYAPEVLPEPEPHVLLDPLPDDGYGVDDGFIDELCAQFQKTLAHHEAEKWREFRLPFAGPYAICNFGDEHLDDPKCNWPLLKAHAALCASNPRILATGSGDLTNNWPTGGKLGRLEAKQEMSKSRAYKLSKHFLHRMGIRWLYRIMGNHDAWELFSELLRADNPTDITFYDWEAKVVVKPPVGRPLRINAAHNFKGSSRWHKQHGLQVEAYEGEECDIVIAGHHHNCVITKEQHPKRGFIYHLVRARGYKWIDDHATVLGFGQQPMGASVLFVIDPLAPDPTNFVRAFDDPFEGAAFLDWKVARWEAGQRAAA